MRFKGASLIDFWLIECQLSSLGALTRASCQEADFVKTDVVMLRRDLYDEMDHILTSGQSNRKISCALGHLFCDSTSSMVYNFLEHIFHRLNASPNQVFPFGNIVFFVLFIM